MAFIQINGAQVYYETFGKTVVESPPVLLIHGALTTGKFNWELVAPLLARRWHVIVPDCRGHGKSSNPNHSYNFRQMADDMKALIQALGYESAHIIGHSNGGNVALVTLMKHPEVVQTAVLQAANAYISPDLMEREPYIFDPKRIENEDREWMEILIDLHGSMHGDDYWRDLMQMTLKETLSEPNYTGANLSKVEKPVLVIQGEHDSANTPGRHAQFLSANIPYAEQWLAPETGHNVHIERPFEWIERVETFLDQRGSPVGEALFRLKFDRYSDPRITIFDLQARQSQNKLRITGKTLTAEQRQSALEAIIKVMPEANIDAGNVQVLQGESTPWALCKHGVTNLRCEPQSQAERISQVLMGEVVQILEENGEWNHVRTERDGCLGWMKSAALQPCSQTEANAYRASCHSRVQAHWLQTYTSRRCSPGEEAGALPFGVQAPFEHRTETATQLRLPGGRFWWVKSSGLLPKEQWPAPDTAGIASTMDVFRKFIGVPYLWGGRSPFGFDCSGFAAAFWEFMGICLPRDADQQFQTGKPVEGDREPGDLLFFGTREKEKPDIHQQGRFASITHVAISMGGADVIHAIGATGSVSYNSLDPESPRYRVWLHDHFVGSRRYI